MKNLIAAHIMKFPVFCSLEENTLDQILKKLLVRKISVMPIVSPEKAVLGVISKKDILGHLYRGQNINNLRAGDIIDRDVVTAEVNSSVKALMRPLIWNDLTCIPVMEHGKLVGIITVHDILKVIAKKPPGFLTVTKKQPSVTDAFQ